MTLLTSRIWQNPNIFTPKYDFKIISNVIWSIESNIHAPVLLNSLNLLPKRDKCLTSLTFYLFSSTRLINSIKHEQSCKILSVDAKITFNNHFSWRKAGFHTPVHNKKNIVYWTKNTIVCWNVWKGKMSEGTFSLWKVLETFNDSSGTNLHLSIKFRKRIYCVWL